MYDTFEPIFISCIFPQFVNENPFIVVNVSGKIIVFAFSACPNEYSANFNIPSVSFKSIVSSFEKHEISAFVSFVYNILSSFDTAYFELSPDISISFIVTGK